MFNVLEYLGKVIMRCISTSLISMLVNGGALEPFQPSRGIRQGDLMAPYIFIMCMEVLGFLIKDKCDSNLWDPVCASRGRLAFSHLFFVDDLVLFAKANKKNCQSVKDIMDMFCDLSRQKVNQGKFRVYFSPNVGADMREELCSIIDLLLGSTSQDFNFIIENV